MPIEIRELNHIYKPGTPMANQAIFDIDLDISDGEIVGVIGRTGSGKSTLIQHMNGLLKPTSGVVVVDDITIGKSSGKKTSYRELRQRVGVVFQYPEHQLFEETVYEDIAFGPHNLGLSSDVVDRRVRQAMEMVGLSFEQVAKRSPLQLSGGQMRRVALAGVLAMHPQKIVLDEPTAGLDPKGRESVLQLISELHRRWKLTVILVTHQMEEVARIANKLIVMDRGKVALQGTPTEVFALSEMIVQLGLELPAISRLLHQLHIKGWPVRTGIFDTQEAVNEIFNVLTEASPQPAVKKLGAPLC